MPATPATSKFRLSTDTWAVVLALGAALVIRLGLIKSVAW